MITIRFEAFLISIIFWLIITIRYTIPMYKIEGKFDTGALIGMILISKFILFVVTCVVIELVFKCIDWLMIIMN